MLIPLAAVQLILLLLRMGLSAWDTDASSFVCDLLGTLSLGLTALWLLLPTIAHTGRVGVFFLGLLILEMAGLVIAVVRSPTLFFLQAVPYGVAALAAALALMLAGVFCRRGYTPGRFLRRLAPASIAAVLLIALPFLLLGMLVAGIAGDLGEALFGILAGLGAGIFGAGIVLWLVLLPFILLAIRSSLYRERLYGTFRLPGMSVADPPPPVAPK